MLSVGDRTTLGVRTCGSACQALAGPGRARAADFSADRRTNETEATKLLEPPATEVGLAGYWYPLQADLVRRAGEPAPAAKQLDQAAKAKPAPSERDLCDVEIPLRIGQNQFAEAAPGGRSHEPPLPR